MIIGYRLVGFAALGLAIAVLLSMSGCSRDRVGDEYLIKVRSNIVTVSEFKQAMETAREEAFPGDRNPDQAALNDLRIRVLNNLSEELIIVQRAGELGLSVSVAELESAVAAIKADYPDNTFEETLLENAVSYEFWKKKLATRLLVDKVIEKELVDKVQITSEDVGAYYRAHYPQGPPDGEDSEKINEKIVTHLRQQKAEQAYKTWISEMRQTFPVEVNRDQWDRMLSNGS